MQTSQLAVGQWVHVALTLGNGTAKLYVNGEETASANVTIKPSDFKPTLNYHREKPVLLRSAVERHAGRIPYL